MRKLFVLCFAVLCAGVAFAIAALAGRLVGVRLGKTIAETFRLGSIGFYKRLFGWGLSLLLGLSAGGLVARLAIKRLWPSGEAPADLSRLLSLTRAVGIGFGILQAVLGGLGLLIFLHHRAPVSNLLVPGGFLACQCLVVYAAWSLPKAPRPKALLMALGCLPGLLALGLFVLEEGFELPLPRGWISFLLVQPGPGVQLGHNEIFGPRFVLVVPFMLACLAGLVSLPPFISAVWLRYRFNGDHKLPTPPA